MLDLARTHAAIAQAEATARLADQLAYRRADNWATQALLAPYEPAGACPDCPPGGGECDVCGGTGRAAEDA